MIKKICEICGCEFIPNSNRQKTCKKQIKLICPICKNEYISYCGDKNHNTCGDKICKNTYTRNQIENTISKTQRECVLCHKLFHPKTNSQKYCMKMHPIICNVCGKEFITDTSKQDFAKTCSKECKYKMISLKKSSETIAASVEKAKLTNLRKYGVEHPAQNKDILEKMKQTNLKRYGDTAFVRTPEYIEKAKATNRKRYGADWPGQTEEIKQKRAQTNLKKYGVVNPAVLQEYIQKAKDTYLSKTGYKHPMQNPEHVASVKSSNLEKYGNEYAGATSEAREKAKNTMLKRYGVDSPLKSDKIRNKVYATNMERYGNISYLGSLKNRDDMKQKMMERYGVDFYSKTYQWKSDRMVNPDKIENWLKFLDDPKSWMQSYDTKPNLYKLSSDLGVSETTVSYWINYHHLTDTIKYTLSTMEEDVVDFIKSIHTNIQIRRHVRDLIDNHEIDIYLPEYKLAIECNPTVTHNSSIPTPWGDLPKFPSYHKEKTDLCAKNGVFLFHLFGYEWTHNRCIMESMLRNLVNACHTKVYARNCIIKEVSSAETTEFLNKNHRQGAVGATVRIGLYYNDELISIMTFGKMRYTVGTSRHENLENCWELSRFCSKLCVSVVGGASKLFKYFVATYKPARIRSFSDKSHTRGIIYETLGFKELHTSKPSYVWVDSKTDEWYHRYNAQKKNLSRFLHDDNIDMSKTEWQIMEEHGFVRVYDSGTILWEYIVD